jgi:hypothetical protein
MKPLIQELSHAIWTHLEHGGREEEHCVICLHDVPVLGAPAIHIAFQAASVAHLYSQDSDYGIEG